MSLSENELLKSPEQEEAEKEAQQIESEEISESDDSVVTVIPVSVIGEELGSEISRSITIVGKSVTHRGTQTVIHCKSDVDKDTFFQMILDTKISKARGWTMDFVQLIIKSESVKFQSNSRKRIEGTYFDWTPRVSCNRGRQCFFCIYKDPQSTRDIPTTFLCGILISAYATDPTVYADCIFQDEI